MSYHEGSNWQAKKEDAGKPLYENEKINKEQKNNPKHGLMSIKVMQDDGEWYLIPSVLEDTFNSALKDANFNEEGNDKFIKLFSQYRVIGDLSSIKLYIADKKHTGATEYATKLHQAEQEKDRVLKSAIRYALDKDELENKLAALQAKCERYQKSLEKISRTSYLVGQPGCTWCDTDLDSVAVAAGYNQALDNIVPIANEALSGEGEKEEFADLQKHIMGGKGDEDRTDNLTKKEDKQ